MALTASGDGDDAFMATAAVSELYSLASLVEKFSVIFKITVVVVVAVVGGGFLAAAAIDFCLSLENKNTIVIISHKLSFKESFDKFWICIPIQKLINNKNFL